jgi:hypothetical protein
VQHGHAHRLSVSELVTGAYLLLDYYDVPAGSEVVRGSQVALFLNYDTLHWRLTNDPFLALVRGAWISDCRSCGSRPEQVSVAAANGT